MKQEIQSVDGPINAHIKIPGSKSITNRALLLAALAEGVSELSNVLISDDTLAFIHALQELGVIVQLDEESQSCMVAGCMGVFPKTEASIWCDSAGTVARFLLAACAASPGTYHFDGTEQLKKRPISLLVRTLCSQGAKLVGENTAALPFTIVGTDGLRGGEIEIDGSKSSQFISALLIVASYAKSPVLLNTYDLVNDPYVNLTCAIMGDFGVRVHKLHQARYSIPTPQRYEARDFVIEPDFSTASYFFAAAAVTKGQITIQKVDRFGSKQGDAEFLTVLEKMGCEVIESEQGLIVKGTEELKGVSVDMRKFSDTFMTLAALAPFANSPTTITNIEHTREHESNRISVMREGLEALNVKVEEGADWLKIYPSEPRAGTIETHQDHRIAMAFSIIGLKVKGVIINDSECVAKTCPNFFELWSQLTR